MSFLMSGLAEAEQVVLCPQDFPLDFADGQHPDDYHVTSTPIVPDCIFHDIRGSRFSRLWWRVSWKLRNGKFTTMSFLLYAGAPKHLYLCDKALRLLEEDGQVAEDSDMGLLCVNLFGRKCPVEPMPNSTANIIGLKLLKRFGLELFEEEPHFSFKVPMPFLDYAKL